MAAVISMQSALTQFSIRLNNSYCNISFGLINLRKELLQSIPALAGKALNKMVLELLRKAIHSTIIRVRKGTAALRRLY